METEWRLTRLCQAFSYYLDYRQYDKLIALFTEDAVWGRIREIHHGKDEIRAGLKARNAQMATRHAIANLHFEHLDERMVKGVLYNYSFFGPVRPDGSLPANYAASHGYLIDFHDTYRLTNDGWKIAERIAKGVMLEPDSAMMAHAQAWRASDYA